MEIIKITALINAITKRDFVIKTNDVDLILDKKYIVYRTLKETERVISFEWTVPKTIEKILKSFITTFSNKYKEPNPKAYNGRYSSKTWEDMSEIERERAYYHHGSNMFSKKSLLEMIEENFKDASIKDTLCKYGFYTTEYGIGIFCFYATNAVKEAIKEMGDYLGNKLIPYKNEFSDAKWVLRFKINLDKNMHKAILEDFVINLK